jgi:hypothetical protein
MIQGKEYRVCQNCDTPHYENCGTCFGFGIYSFSKMPIAAFEIDEIRVLSCDSGWEICPECHSSPRGIPKGIDTK